MVDNLASMINYLAINKKGYSNPNFEVIDREK
jgi:hypothetical protein